MRTRKLRLVGVPLSLLAIALLSITVYADGTTIRIPACMRAGGVSVPAGSPITLVAGWTMSTRGNTEAFANAAAGIITVDGQSAIPVKSDVFQLFPDSHPDGNADDAWRVQWSFATTAPAQGQTMVATFNIVLAHQVADHEFGSGKPSFLPAGPLFPTPISCTVTGS